MSEHYEARFMFIIFSTKGSAEELLVRELPSPIISLGEVIMAPSEDIRCADEDGKLELRLVHLIKCQVTTANDRWPIFGLDHVKLQLHLMCCKSGDAPDVILSLLYWSRGEPLVATEQKHFSVCFISSTGLWSQAIEIAYGAASFESVAGADRRLEEVMSYLPDFFWKFDAVH